MEENKPVPILEQGSPQEPSKRVGNLLQNVGINMLMIGVLALLGLLAWQRFFPGDGSNAGVSSPEIKIPVVSSDEPLAFQPESSDALLLSPLATPLPSLFESVSRRTNWRTVIPTRPRVDVITYTVQSGDTLFSIAYSYGLKPETLLWGNFDLLEDNPHLLKPNQALRILPVDGVLYEWKEGDNLQGVAATFKASLEDILDYPGNAFDLTQIDASGSSIQPGSLLIIPGGKRAIKDWGPPAITRSNPAVARYYGEGACGEITSGAYGTGTFIWPTTDRTLSGYNYDPNVHPAIDIGGQEGNSIFATDSGVVVFAGWSNYGYGYMIVLDHGNGWQSAYAHLSAVAVNCGQSVYQGGYIGALGTTGNSSGPHLHFELSINGVKVTHWIIFNNYQKSVVSFTRRAAMENSPKPLYIINSVAPIRICDVGGWTDTWFAGHGRIFNIAVYPYVEVQIAVFSAGHLSANSPAHVLIKAENYGDSYIYQPQLQAAGKRWLRHPLIEAGIEMMHTGEDQSFEVTIHSEAPAGASTGTSAAVAVALIGGLNLLTPGRMTAHEVALAAQRIETELLGQQCGIQDQLCSAYGGINYIDMHQYPYATVSPIQIPNPVWWELERRLALVYLGNSHHSSQVHEMVIRGLEDSGPDCQSLEDLRQTAPKARAALINGDFIAFGAAMIENTEAQQRLHSALVSPAARQVIEMARAHGAIGWKVNGAGGEGGSLTILCGPRSETKRAMLREIDQEDAHFRNIPIYLSRFGLRVWKDA